MEIEFDETKRIKILAERGLDLADAAHVFADDHFQIEDVRRDYGVQRFRVWGYLRDRRVSLVWTPLNGRRRIITMRFSHEQEHEAHFRTLD